ncbi:MAG: SDR family oxidoreductase [Oligoflexales bacterium]|nr:SDR family oxidoreductase [Oligoflexales bacterium]
MKGRRVLVAGGAGFLGSHLCDRFVREGWEVICLDNFHTGQKRNVRHLMHNENFELLRHDITRSYFAEVDLIMNFACPASPVHYQSNPIKTMKTSVLGTMNLLGLAKRTGARFVQASTSEVYGDPERHPQPESYWGNVNPVGIRSCYDEGKRASETLCFDYHRMHKVDIRVVRIFNTYGPRMAVDDGRVVSNFIVQALRGEDLTIYGDGSQTRSFCYCDDLIEGIWRFSLKDGVVGPLNMGNTGEFSVKELACEILKLTGSSSRIVFRELPDDDPKVRRPDMTRTKEILSFEATVSLREGLIRTIPYFQEVLAVAGQSK